MGTVQGIAEKLFVFDEGFDSNREERMKRRAKELGAGVHLPLEVSKSVVSFLIARLKAEHPDHFFFEENFDGSGILSCRLTGELLSFDSEGVLVDAQTTRGPIFPKYVSAFDALCSQTQAEVKVVTLDEREGAWPIPETGLMVLATHSTRERAPVTTMRRKQGEPRVQA